MAGVTAAGIMNEWKVECEKENGSGHRYVSFRILKEGRARCANDGEGSVRSNDWIVTERGMRKLNQYVMERGGVAGLTDDPEQIIKEIGDVRDACLRKKSGKSGSDKSAVYWWNDEIEELRKECVRMRRKMTRVKGVREMDERIRAAEEEHKEVQKTLKVSIRNVKREAWKGLCADLETDIWGLGYKIVAGKLNHLKASHLSEVEMLWRVDELFPNMADCVTRILTSGVFAKIWKRARVVLVEKPKREPSAEPSYRPICLIDGLGKIAEKKIKTRLLEEVMAHGMIS
ncbi:uncharacterized protein [Euwallacea fornicatus]|uniref:uncharacterized protein n=1 Tax=Euwallacea fornicatus TaxID=995702 RepID=UPI00339064C6